MKRKAGLIVAAAFVLACGKGADSREGARGQAERLGDTAATMGTSQQPATPATPRASGVVSDGSILALVARADSTEVALATLVQTKATAGEVSSFAATLYADHVSHAADLGSLALTANIARQPPHSIAADQENQRVLGRLRSMGKGADFDGTFLNRMVDEHERMMIEAMDLERQAKAPAVRDMLRGTLALHRKHLEHALTLQKVLRTEVR